MQLGAGPWLHAFELRFLLNDRANLPPGELESLKKKTALAIEMPDEAVLLVNLIIGPVGSPLGLPLPVEFSGGQSIWRTRLRDDRIALLVARPRPLDDANREHIRYLLEKKITVTYDTMPETRYAEFHDIYWSPGGNVICILPMGDEAFRSEREALQPDAIPARSFHYRCLGATIMITAPDGKAIGAIEFPEVEKRIELVKGQPRLIQLGTVIMQVQPGNLIPGSCFLVRPPAFAPNPQIDGAGFRDWQNEIVVEFDGFQITASVSMTSGALLNKNLAKRIEALDDAEELVVAFPFETMRLSATLDGSSASTECFAKLTLRDRR